ncbi:hypothetical protein BDN72DRAFT_907500 [Pluteus cervinus]|uniref:Uncharacterized protein n=1 Tax=Pluteus cervinus TaxID=181527 RepID=A0ACD2ZX42_9AGAR|nr:hypothetical protein BDN72DRAFT_907500 [Pluteus cervinus]
MSKCRFFARTTYNAPSAAHELLSLPTPYTHSPRLHTLYIRFGHNLESLTQPPPLSFLIQLVVAFVIEIPRSILGHPAFHARQARIDPSSP